MTHATTEVMDKGGMSAMVGGTLLWITDKLNLINVNDVLTGISLLVGIIWVCFKIRNETLTYKINKRELEKGDKLD
jgi:hypothetical protein